MSGQQAPVLFLKKEGGKKITVTPFGTDVVITVWRKNDGVLLPLVLNRMEAQRLQTWIKAVVDTPPYHPTGATK